MEKPRKSIVTVLSDFSGELLRVSTFNDITDIKVQERVTNLYTQEFPYNDSLLVGVIPNHFVLRIVWEDL